MAKLEPLVDAAKKFESALHKKVKDEKNASWVSKLAKQADIALDDEVDSFGSKKKRKQKEVKAIVDIFDEDLAKYTNDEEGGARHKQKQLTKVQLLKKKYDDLKKLE